MESRYLVLVAAALVVAACAKEDPIRQTEDPAPEKIQLTLESMAKIISALPIGTEQLGEVRDAVNSSSENGYDEEYMMRDLFLSPGCGVGADTKTKAERAGKYSRPMKDLIRDYLESGTKAGSLGIYGTVEDIISGLADSDMQIYWPYSEDWDGETLPVITFNPGYGAESNYGYLLKKNGNGGVAVDSVIVDETMAKTRPVWVINTNDDSAFTPFEMYSHVLDSSKAYEHTDTNFIIHTSEKVKSKPRMLMLKSFTMLRNYDSWFGGASEFFVKCGSVNGFSASTEAELKLYSPSVTDMMIVVKRKYKGVALPLNSVILTDFTNQLDQLAFLITEDDGGTTTSWKCSAIVKVQSKSYGFDVDIPYKDKDDIVWRGQLSANFFQSADEVSGRFGDVIVNFALE